MNTNELFGLLPAEHEHALIDAITPAMRWNGQTDPAEWQRAARVRLTELLGLAQIEAHRTDPRPTVEYDRYDEKLHAREIRFRFFSEENVSVPCHLLIPADATEPLPVVLCIQGHTKGMHVSMARVKYPGDAATIRYDDHDFVLPVLQQGLCALTLEQRCMGERGGTPNGPACQEPALRALLLGRTMIGGGVSKTDMLQYGKAGYFVDLAKNLDKMPNLARALETYKDSNADVFTSVDGELYTSPNYVFTYSSSDQLALTYFTDMAEEIGYSKEKGNMPKTVDEFYTFLKAAQDKFGANDPEFHALRAKWGGLSFPSTNIYNAFGPGLGGFNTAHDGKTIQLDAVTDQQRNYLKFMHQCYEDGILNPDLFSEEKTSNIALVKAKKSIAFSVEMHNFSKDDFGGDWKLDYVGPFTSQWQAKAHTATYCGSYGSFSNNAVNAKGKNVDIAMQWLDGLYADEDHPLAEGLWGISMWIGKEGTDWVWGDDKHETYKMLIDDEAIAGFWTGFNIVWPKVVVADDASFAQSKFQSTNKEILENIEHDVAVNVGKLTLTDDESEVISTYAADIQTAISTATTKFLTGEAGYDIDSDADWNAFVKSIQDMHTDDVIKAYQSALDRYNDSKAALNK